MALKNERDQYPPHRWWLRLQFCLSLVDRPKRVRQAQEFGVRPTFWPLFSSNPQTIEVKRLTVVKRALVKVFIHKMWQMAERYLSLVEDWLRPPCYDAPS